MPVPEIFAHLSLVSAAAHPELVATPVVGWVCIGSGLRTSKLLVPASELAQLPGAEVIENLGRPVG